MLNRCRLTEAVESRSVDPEAGFVVYFAALFLATVSLFTAITMSHSDSALTNTESFLKEKRTFYINEGMRAVGTTMIQNYLETVSTVDPVAMQASLAQQFSKIAIPGYTIVSPTVSFLSTTTDSDIPTGPYSGMQSPITSVDLKLQLNSSIDSNSSNLDVTMGLGDIFPFQFMYFVDLPYADWKPGPKMRITGRTHVNGDICPSGNSVFDRITASGRMMNLTDSRCKYVFPTASDGEISTNAAHTTFGILTPANDNGCTNCAGTGQNWRNYALSHWGGNAMDTAHQIHFLKLPDQGVGNLAQYGVDGDAVTATSNQTNMRFVVDPPVIGESPIVLKQKFSYNADVRVVDGVWYLRDPQNSANWPGIPIWSDHPGHADASGMGVGQEDIRARWAATSHAWNAAGPQKFSFYGYSNATKTISAAGTGILSYGNLTKNILSGNVEPASFIEPPATGLCPTGSAPLCIIPIGGFFDSVTPIHPCSCVGSVTQPGVPTFVLNSTRGGFTNGHVQKISLPPNNVARSQIFPVNFDVGQFQAALTNTGAGELGSYFGPGSFMGKSFDGIVYLTSSWPHSSDGYGTGQPAEYPYQGSVVDAAEPAAFSSDGQGALPIQLCSNSPTAANPGYAGQPFDQVTVGATTSSAFVIPDCAKYADGTINSYPNSVRLINGANLNMAILPLGLSVVSNLPTYVMGDYNANSDVSTGTSGPWVSSLIAGDEIIQLSNSFMDAELPWNHPFMMKIGINTTVHSAFLSGMLRANNANQFHAFPAFIENWAGFTFTYSGSMVLGFFPVNQRSGISQSLGQIYGAPTRTFSFDPHFAIPINQPPGAMIYPISALSKWKRN